MNNIQSAIERLHQKHRLVFWYDPGRDFYEDFQQLELNTAEKLEVELAGFGVKYFLLKEEPEKRFLLYFPFDEPAVEENFLLDLQLSNVEFRTDKASIYAQELELPLHLKEVIDAHLAFFNSKERREKLLRLLPDKPLKEQLMDSMLAVAFGADRKSLEHYLFEYASDYLKDKDRMTRQLERFHLSPYFWARVDKHYQYPVDSPSIYEFIKLCFKRASNLFSEKDPRKYSGLLLKLWQDSRSHQETYRDWAISLAEDLAVKNQLGSIPYKKLAGESIFREPDLKAISDLASTEMNSVRDIDDALEYIREKRTSFWFDEHRGYYQTLENGLLCRKAMMGADGIEFEEYEEAVKSYMENWYQVDYYYRKFIFHYRSAMQNKVFQNLYQQINNRYSNTYLLNLATAWQKIIDSKSWKLPYGLNRQRGFFARSVKPSLDQQRTVVIISDGLRYEAAVELMERFRRENRFEASLDYGITEVPSYTQLGMAALLPHSQLSIKNKSQQVLADDIPSLGVQGRGKILAESSGVSATAINAEEIMKMPSSTAGREFIKQYQLIYVYHNAIDKEGDDKTTEHRVFDAVEEEISYLMNLCKALTNMNVSKMIITADHGFLYENEPLSNADFNLESPAGEEVWSVSRRFAIGKGLQNSNDCVHFTSDELQLKGDFEVLIPKFMNRFRVKGAGSRYVHGGMSMQELLVPVLSIKKKREDTTRYVDIDIIKSTEKITTNILPITFIQSEPVTDYVHARKIKAFLQAEDGQIISDTFIGEFSFEDKMDRQRKIQHHFHIKADAPDKYNKQYVKLVLQEPVDRDNWRHYKDFVYVLNISVHSDFDFDL